MIPKRVQLPNICEICTTQNQVPIIVIFPKHFDGIIIACRRQYLEIKIYFITNNIPIRTKRRRQSLLTWGVRIITELLNVENIPEQELNSRQHAFQVSAKEITQLGLELPTLNLCVNSYVQSGFTDAIPLWRENKAYLEMRITMHFSMQYCMCIYFVCSVYRTSSCGCHRTHFTSCVCSCRTLTHS